MKISKNITLNSKILLTINILIFSVYIFAVDFNDYIEFNPSLYEITSREITDDKSFLEFELPEETQKMTISLDRNNSTYNLYILNFKSIYKLNSFWYNFVGEFSSDFNAFISTVPAFYGRYNGLYNNEVMYTWFVGLEKNMFIVIGSDKTIVEDLKYKINKFR
ncbi:MAG: hypothetical protein ACQESN_02135 [Thermotogota bacterium]